MTTLRQIKLASNLPFTAPEIIDITDSLPKNPKGDWLHMPIRRKDGELRTGPRSIEQITHISVHHTAVERGTPEGHARYHISKGDGGIAYHLYVNGSNILQVNDLLAFTWHTQSNNDYTVGIVVEGDFTKRSLTPAERSNLYAAIISVMLTLGIPVENVRGHREYTGTTSCPGFDMNQVRAELSAILETMQYQDSDNQARSTAYTVAERILDLYNKAKSPGPYQQEAMRKLLLLAPHMKEQGLLK